MPLSTLAFAPHEHDVASDGGKIDGNKCLCSVFLHKNTSPPHPHHHHHHLFFCETPQKNSGIKETTQSQKDPRLKKKNVKNAALLTVTGTRKGGVGGDRGLKNSSEKLRKIISFKSMDSLKMYQKYVVCLNNLLYM